MTLASICGPTCGVQLFTHVLGAAVLFGAAVATTLLWFVALWRPPEQAVLLCKIAFWTTVGLMVPAWIVMRIGGQWVQTHEGLDKLSLTWVDIGFDIADGGAVLIILMIVTGWFAIKRPRFVPYLAGIGVLYIAALTTAIFVMTAKHPA